MDSIQKGNNEVNLETLKIQKADGVKNWLIIMVLVFAVHIIFNNYMKFGLVETPLDIFFGLVGLITRHWWLYCATVACYFLQVFFVYIIETLLALEILSEKVGMTLHALDVFFLPTAFTILARFVNACPLISRIIASQVMYVMTKTWSYAFVNSKLRKISTKEGKLNKNNYKDNPPLHQYPDNVTITNLLTYFIFTPPIQYQPRLTSEIKPKWKTIIKYLAKQFLVLYMVLLISIQFIFTELVTLETKKNEWIADLTCIANIFLPAFLIWLLLYYVSTYKVYLPAYAEFAGMKNVVFSMDWWNSENLNVFWRKWNTPVHECLKCNVVVPLMKNGYSKTFSIFVAFILAGILHEYLNTLPFGIYNGSSILLTILEIPAGYITTHIGKTFGNQIGNFAFWIYLLSCHITAILVYRRNIDTKFY